MNFLYGFVPGYLIFSTGRTRSTCAKIGGEIRFHVPPFIVINARKCTEGR